MGLAVVTVAAGGLPVVDVTAIAPRAGTPVSEATNGYGVAVTKVAALGMPVVFETIGVAPVAPILTTFATYNGALVGVTLSNGNLTATHGNTSDGAGVKSATFLSSGKYYFEIQVGIIDGDAVGIALSATTNNGVRAGNGCVTIRLDAVSGKLWSNNVNTLKDIGVCAGAKICFAIDLTARRAWARRNGDNWNVDAAADPAAGLGGVTVAAGSFAPVVVFNILNAAANYTGNFGQSAFAFAVPAGFSAGWGT